MGEGAEKVAVVCEGVTCEEVMDERMQNLMRLSVENMWTNMTLYLPNVQSVNVDLRNVREDFSLEASNLWARPEIWWFDR